MIAALFISIGFAFAFLAGWSLGSYKGIRFSARVITEFVAQSADPISERSRLTHFLKTFK